MKTQHKYLILGLLYFTQTIPISFIGHAMPAILRDSGLSLEKIAYLQFALVPYAFKFLWAPLVDKYGKSYFRWVSISTALYALFLLPVMFLDMNDTIPLVILLTVAVCSMSTQDLAIDAYAIRFLDEEERSTGNGIQSAGNYFGFLLGGGILLMLYHLIGWSYAILLLVLCTIIPLALTIRYEKFSRKSAAPKNYHARDLFSYFKIKEIRKWVPVLLIISLPMDIVFYFIKPLLIDKGFKLEEVGFLFGTVAIGSAMIAGFMAGLWLKKVTDRRKLMMGLTGSLMGVISAWLLWAVPAISFYAALPLCVIIGGGTGLNTMVIFHISMKNVREGKEATDYAFQAFLRSAFFMLSIPVGGILAERYGYALLFYAMLIVCALVFVLIRRNFDKQHPADNELFL